MIPVKYIHGDMAGSRVISGTPGALIPLLNDFLIDGFNQKDVQAASIDGGQLVLTFAEAHGFEVDQIVAISGATSPTAVNGEAEVVWADSLTIRCAGFEGLGDGAVEGAVSCKVAPVGQWEKAFTGVNKAAYRSIDPAASGMFLRVDDTNALYASVRMYESMTDVDTGIAPSSIYYFRKSNATDSSARGWRLVADSRLFYLGVRWHLNYPTFHGMNAFGDIISHKAGDAYPCWLCGDTTPNAISPSAANDFTSVDGIEAYPGEIARSYTQVGGAVKIYKVGSKLNTDMGKDGPAYPSPVDNGLLLHAPILLREGSASNAPVRGEIPGLIQPVQDKPLTDGHVEKNIPQFPGRGVLLVSVAALNSEARAAFDLRGPWR